MGTLADLVDYVIGVDTHPGTHSATVAAARSGAVDADVTIAANPIGYKRTLRFASHQAAGPRV
jgi:transposase